MLCFDVVKENVFCKGGKIVTILQLEFLWRTLNGVLSFTGRHAENKREQYYAARKEENSNSKT